MAKFVLTAQIALQAPRNVGQVVNQIRRQLQGINVNINVNANTRTLNNVNNQLNTTAKSAKIAQNSISELGKSLGIAARRFGAIAIATGTFLSLSRAIKSSLGDAIEFERQLVNLSQVTGKSVKNLQDITNEITRLSTGLGVSSDQLLKTSIILAQAGLEASKTKAALEVLAKTELASSFDNITNTTEGAIAILSQFRREAAAAGGDVIYLERALGAINDVSKKFAVESADLVAVIRRSGGAFEAAGGSLNELLALFTSVRATTRESAETIATGLRTIFTRIQRVDTIRQLQELGIALQDAEGKFVGPFEAIKRISEGLSGLDPRDFRFAAIVEELGGFRQIGKVIPLIKQFALAQDALNTAQGASSSLTKDAEIAQLSLANQLAKVREEFQALIRRFVDSSSFQTVARGALEFARALIRIADAISPLIPLIASLAAIQIGKGFIPALGALTGVTRRNQGGKIHAFASGGFVPGSGNRDTVPAMLTPGEFVIRKNSAKKIGAERLQRLNEGGPVKSLVSTKESLKERYDVGDTKPKVNDKYKNIKIHRKSLDLDYKASREEAKDIFNKARIIRDRNIEEGKSEEAALIEANEFIKGRTGGLSQNLGNEFNKITESSYNKISGALAEKRVDELYRDTIKNTSLERIPDVDGADFYNPRGKEYIEVKNKLARTDDKELIAKALLAESRDDRKKYKNNNPETISGLKIKLLSTNKKDIDKKNLGGIIQKFAGGGIVDVLTGQESVAALMMTDASPGQTRIPIKYPDDLKSALESRKQGSESITRGNKLLNSVKLDQYGLNKSAGSDFAARLRENLTNGAASAVNQTVGQMAPTFSGLGIRADFKNLIPGEKVKSAISGGVIGTLFESIIDNLSNQSKDVKDSSFFDFVGPLSDNATKLFEKSESVNNSTYKDAKIQIKAKNIESKIINQASQELGLGTNVQSTGQIQTAQDYIDKLTRAGLYEKFKTTGVSFAKLSEAGIKGINKDATLAMLQDKFGVDRVGYRDYQLNQKDPKTGQPRIGRDFFLKYAKGGIASSDTVPALLTPGEFVVNKKTAQEVGYGALNRMNKTGDVQGFAKGGLVGIQRFAQGGGPVTPGPLNVSSQGPPSLNMAALASTFDQLVQQGGGMVTSFNLLKSAVEEMQAAGVKFTAAEKAAIKQMADDARKKAAAEKTQIDSYTKLQKSQQEAKDKFANFKSGIEKTLGSMQQFVFLGTTVLALATQFSSLDEATNSAITETLAMGASIIAVIGTVGDLILSTGLADTALKYFTASVTRAGTAAAASSATGAAGKAGGVAAASSGLLGRLIPLIAIPFGAVIAIVVAALAGFAAYIYFIQARARKVAEGLRKSADTIADNIEKGKGGSAQEFVDLQVKAAQTVTDSYLTFFGLLDAAGRTSAKARQEEVNAVKRSAEAYIGVVQSISDVNKSIANIDLDKTLKPAEAAFKKIAAIDTGVRSQTGVLSGPSSQFQEIAKLAEREGIRKPVSQITEADFSSDTAKTQFKLANDAITKVTEDFEKRIPESISLLQTQLEDSLQSVNFGQAATQDLNNDNIFDSFDTVLQQNQAFANSVNAVIKLIQIEAQARADAARQAGKFVEAGNIEANAQERVKVVQEAIQKQAVAFAKSQESALAFQAALEASTAQFKGLSATTQFISKLGDQAKEFGNRISTLGDIMSGEMPTFEVDQIQGLGNLSEIQDLDKFTQEVGKLGASMGPKGKELAGNLASTASLMENAKRELTGINFAEIGGDEESAAKTAFKKAFGDQLDTIFPGVGGKLRTVMEKRLENAIRTASEAGGMVDPAELENILDPLKQMTEETRKMFEAYNNAQIEFVNQYNNTSKMLLEVMERDIDGRQKIVDIQNRGLERMDQATGRTPGFQEKEARRNASRGSRLGSLGLGALTGDIRGMGNALRNTNQNLEANSQKIKQDPGNEVLGRSQRLLTLQANELKKALEDLTDQSDKASDIMGEIDKERAKRDTLTKIVEDFVVGNNEERMSTVRQFQGIEFAAATGSLQGLQPEDRKATFGLLSQLADVDDGFKQLKENLVMRDAIAMGLPPELARALATKTPKEEQLLVELSNLTAQEIAAQQELNRINAEFGGKLSTEINNLSQKIENLGSVIESKLNAEVAKAEQEQGADKALVAAEKAKQEALVGPQQRLSQIKTNRENKEKQIQQKEIELKGAREAAAAGVQQADKAKNKPRTWTDAAIENAPMAFGPAGIAYSATGGPSPITSYRQQEISGYEQNITNQQTIASQREAELNALIQEQQRLLSEERLAQEELKRAQGKARGGLVYRASGGSIFKPKGTDTVPAMLTPGEFVMRKAAVDKYGADTMEAMNSGTLYAAEGMHVPKVGYSTPKYKKDENGRIEMGADGRPLLEDNPEPYITPNYKKDKDGRIVMGKQGKPELLAEKPRFFSDTKPIKPAEFDANDAYNNEAKINLILSRQAKEKSMARLQSKPKVTPSPTPKINPIVPNPDIAAPAASITPTTPSVAGVASNKYGESDDQSLKELGGTYGKGRHHDPQKSLALSKKRQAEEIEKRQIRMGQIDPMAKRKADIQEKLQKRQFNIQSARFNRKQEALPSYMRSETPQNLRSFDDFKRAQGGGNVMQPAMGMGMGAQVQAMQPQMMGQGAAGVQGMNGGMAQGQGFNMEPLVQLKQTFDNLAGVLNNMQMTHQVNVDGALNINGVDAPQVAEAIKQYLGNFIVTEVNKIINNQGKVFKGQT